jgi:hypothetical protein
MQLLGTLWLHNKIKWLTAKHTNLGIDQLKLPGKCKGLHLMTDSVCGTVFFIKEKNNMKKTFSFAFIYLPD